MEHQSFKIEHEGSRIYARCSCGWESARTTAAGLAGALWDDHAGEHRRPDDQERGA